MANILKNKLYPYIKKYINEYLHGFTQEKIDIQLAKGEVKLEKMSLRPDTINKIMDENNVPFWIKVGLIKKIGLGASVLSVIGEIPLEVEIEGVDIILSPSYKWIISNIENLSNSRKMDTSNPLGNDIFNKKPDDLDLSIFKIEKIQEIFRDKTILSNIINNIFKSLYSFYTSPNFSAIIKIKNVHIRFEDDELMNYTGDIALGLRINLIQIKVGCKGNMKKDSIKLESLDIYWENEAKILISSNFLNSCIIDGQLQEKYYANLKNIRFERFEYLPNTKFIIQDFNFKMNLGTKSDTNEDIDIFDIKASPSMVYLQLASNELSINIFPEIAKIQNNFSEFLSKFPIIEKVKDYRPFIKPTETNSLKYINLVENYRKNVIDDNNKKKLLVRDWINYFYWFEKSKKGGMVKQINPVRTEFTRFYNICFKKIDIHKILKEKKEEEKTDEKKEEKKEEKKIIKNVEKEEDNPEDSDNKNEKKIITIAGETPIGYERENIEKTPGETPDGETPTGETPLGDDIQEIIEIPKDFDFSTRIDLLLKAINVNLHSPLSDKVGEYISLSINGIEIKIKLSKEKFDFNFKIKTIDLGPSNLNIGQRVIIQPKSYRKAIPEQNMTSLNSNIPYGNLSTYNYISLPNSDLGSRITGLIKKYNPKHEEKIKKIDEALELAENNSRMVSLAASEMGDFNKFKMQNKLRSKTPFGENSVQNMGQSVINLNVADLGKTYGSVFVPRNVTFAKNLIDNYEGNALENKKYERKKNNEINISQAINDYNSYKNQEKLKLRASRSPPSSSLASSRFNLRESQFGIRPNVIRGRNVPLNLLEIFSNTEVGALSLKFTKYNNPVTIDCFSIQIGTIRLNMFANYLLDILRILSEYKKATNVPKISSSKGTFSPSGQSILEMQEYFYNYLLKKIPDSEKTESMKEYMEYLRKEIISKKKFSSKPEHFTLNQIFSFFPKGFEFHFDYENIEVVAYDKDNVVSSKIIIPSSEIILSLTFTKIFVKLLELEVEISDLNRCETIIEQLKDLAKDKFKVLEIVIEPCYKQIKDGIEPILKDNSVEYKQILKAQKDNINTNIDNNKNTPIMQGENIEQEENEEENLEINNLLDKQFIIQKQQEENQKIIPNHLLIQKQKEQQEMLLKKQKEQQLLIQQQKQKEQEEKLLLMKQQQEKERLQQIQLQKQKEALINQQQLLLLQQQKQQKELINQNNPKLHPQNSIPKPHQQILSQSQGPILQQKISINQSQLPNKNLILKNSRIAAPTANLSTNLSQSTKGKTGGVKIPKDNNKTKIKFSNFNNYNSVNVNNSNLPKLQRQFSGGSSHQVMNNNNQVNINPQIQQYIGYNTSSNDQQIQNLYNTNYNITVPNLNNNGYIYHNNNQQNSYITGNSNQIIDNNDEFNLFNNAGYSQ